MKKIVVLTLFSLLVLPFQSCDNDDDTPPIELVLAIGDYHEGGVIFYLDENGENGLVCTVSEQSFGSTWKCDTNIIIQGAQETAIGTGAQNTADILFVCDAAPTIAAAICNSLDLNGYTDWFLPSKDELNEIYENKDIIDDTAVDNGGALLQSTNYWSSSHLSSNTVWVQTFAQGGSQYGNSDDSSNHVRAIRSF
jgi:hypothetical protein